MLSVVAPAFAHHSPAAFEAQKTVTLTGVIKEFRWQNPHTWIERTCRTKRARRFCGQWS